MRKDSTKAILTFVVLIFLLIISTTSTVLYVANTYLDAKRSSVPVFIFLKDNVSRDQANSFLAELRKDPRFKKVELIDKSFALSDILSKLNLPKSQFSSNPLPYSLEIFLKSKIAANQSDIDLIEKNIKRYSVVDEIKVPKGLFVFYAQTFSTFKEFAYALIGIFIILEVIIIALLLKVIYEHKREFYNKLKILGIRRFRVFFMFLLKNLISSILAALLAIVLGAGGMLFYLNYVNLIPSYQDQILMAFIFSGSATIVFSLLVIIILSFFVFYIEDEKI